MRVKCERKAGFGQHRRSDSFLINVSQLLPRGGKIITLYFLDFHTSGGFLLGLPRGEQ